MLLFAIAFANTFIGCAQPATPRHGQALMALRSLSTLRRVIAPIGPLRVVSFGRSDGRSVNVPVWVAESCEPRAQ